MVDLLPDLDGHVHGIKSRNGGVITIQCDACGDLWHGNPNDPPAVQIMLCPIKFSRVDEYRSRRCPDCAEEAA